MLLSRHEREFCQLETGLPGITSSPTAELRKQKTGTRIEELDSSFAILPIVNTVGAHNSFERERPGRYCTLPRVTHYAFD